jgi:hypothetical protein
MTAEKLSRPPCREGKESTVNAMSITADQFQQIVNVCRRMVINTSTPAEELRFYLALRLREQHPAIARALAEFEDDEFESLCQEILKALYMARN